MPLSTFKDELQALPLLGGYTAADLWPTTNVVVAGWLLLALFPRWKHTMAWTLLPSLFLALIYALGMFSLVLFPANPAGSQPDFTTLEGVFEMFQNPNVVFVGWVHYLVFDLLVGRMIIQDSIDRGASLGFHIFVIVPCLGFTFFLGPIGWLMYTGVQAIFLSESASSRQSEKRKQQ